MASHFSHYEAAAKSVLDHVGKKIVLGLPLGLGKPVGFINALYQLASADKSIDLTIITALTLARPPIQNELEKRLAEPILERMIGDYEDPLYEKALMQELLPNNIHIIEFFLTPAKYLHNHYMQQHYISSAYTHVIRDCLNHSINAIAQLMSTTPDYPNQYSASSNTDLFRDLVKALRVREQAGNKIAVIGEVNPKLPFLPNDAIMQEEMFTHLVDGGKYKTLFALPRDEISIQDHMIGLYTSTLINDNGCLQVGIGTLSNAVAHALIMRHQSNDLYQETIRQLGLITEGLTPFEKGLYASTEMMSDEYMQLLHAGILKKRVYDHIGLQRLLNENRLTDEISANMLDVLVNEGVISAQLTLVDINFLKTYGIFKPDVLYQDAHLIIANKRIAANLSSPLAKQDIVQYCLGERLINGKIAHAGFYLGSTDFYASLHKLSASERQLIDMTSISRTNSLSWNPELLTLQRKDGRFINSAMMITLTGAIISDGLKNAQEVSGVGGQFDFVNMAQALPDARSIITCRSTRETKGGIESNMVWEYPNNTIPRFLRDIVVTEYGIADCRSKTDSEVIQTLLNVTDSRFQPRLLKLAKDSGKIAADYEIPKFYQKNTYENIAKLINNLQSKGHCLPYPFGTELTADERVIKNALMRLKYVGNIKLLGLTLRSLLYFTHDVEIKRCLARMQLDKPKHMREWIYKKLLQYMIYTSRTSAGMTL